MLVAVGGFSRQRKLAVPGETDQRVSYRFQEAYPYAMKRVVVVGGGNSAAEASLDLADIAGSVTLSVRRASLDLPPTAADGAQIKPWVLGPLDDAVRQGKIRLICSSRVVAITRESAILSRGDTGSGPIEEIPCDHILALIGADPDTKLVEQAGAEIAEDGRPLYDPKSYETTVPHLFVAGHLTRERHIKNAIQAGCRIVERLSATLERCSV